MKRSRIFSRGFTLIELMVVVAIIAILVTIGLATYRTAQNRAREAKLISGMRAWRDVAEQKFNPVTNVYTAPVAGDFADGAIPTNVTGNVSAGNYCVTTTVALTANLVTNNCGGCSGGAKTTTTTDRYCLTQLQ